MAAGLGFKTFTTGEVLTAADTNGYLMQGVLVFASSAARAAAITSPQEGQYSYLKDTNSTEYYDGAAWIAAPIGDITGVTAGTGISGGGTSGTVTITNDMATTITAAGDIVVGTGSGTYDNLPIGTTAQVLTADTTVSPYKVKWATASSGTTTKLTYTTPSADVTSTSTSLVDVTGYAVTFTPSSATNKVQITLSLSFKTAASANQDLVLYDGATVIRYGYISSTVPNGEMLMQMTANLTNVSATSHTIQLKQKNAQNTTLTCFGSTSGASSTLSVLEIY
jgi:hypothetical protein